MGRTNVVVDEDLVRRVMDRYGLRTRREAIDFALRQLVGDFRRGDMLDLEGSGWDGDLDELRSGGPANAQLALIVVDMSAWGEYLRATQSPVHHWLRRSMADKADLAVPGVVVMEVLCRLS